MTKPRRSVSVSAFTYCHKKGQIANLVFLPSQRGLEHKDIYLRMVSNYSTISTQQQNSNIKVYAGTLVNKYRSQGTYTMYYGDKQVF